MARYPLEYNQILNCSVYNTFGPVRKHKDGTMRFHKGWDFVAPMGTPVYPVAHGTVTSTRPSPKPGSQYGKTINFKFTEDGIDYWAFYAHLSAIDVQPGEVITSTSQIIGRVGDTGNASGIAASKVHLHFEFRSDSSGGNGIADRIDPVEFYGQPPYDGIFYIDDE